MQEPRVLHALAINGIAGTECLFADYLRCSDPGRVEQHVLVMHGRCHPLFRATLQTCARSVRYANYWRGVKVPSLGGLRRRHIAREIAAIRPDVAVIWNDLGAIDVADAAPFAARVYFERGGAWGKSPGHDVAQFLGKMTKVLCNSQACRRMLQLRWKVQNASFLVHHNPVRSDLAAAALDARRAGLRTPLRIGIIGRMISFKGIPLALHAVKHLLRDGVACELHVAGQGRDEEALRRLAKDLSLEEHVRFRGPYANPAPFYLDIDLLLCPSIREPFGNVAMEAATSGCPVVAAAVDGLPEVVLHERTGLCVQPTLPISDYPQFGGSLMDCPEWVYDPLTDAIQPPKLVAPRALAEAVKSIIHPLERWRAMSDAARQRASLEFRAGDYAHWLDQQFLEVCGRRVSG